MNKLFTRSLIALSLPHELIQAVWHATRFMLSDQEKDEGFVEWFYLCRHCVGSILSDLKWRWSCKSADEVYAELFGGKE